MTGYSITDTSLTDTLKGKQREIAIKIFDEKRLDAEEAMMLYEEFDLGVLGILADHVRRRINGDFVFFNRNVHLEPTNICIHNCLFCSYSRKTGDDDAWEYSPDEIKKIVREYRDTDITEIHIVGGVHPQRNVGYYSKLLQIIREELPLVHIKAFTAAEIDHMAKKAGISITEALQILKKSGLESLPGGGAEIFDEKIRSKISPDKAGSSEWLEIHRQAHKSNLRTNCTMLYGHIENYSHRIDHLIRLRELQDETRGFNAFIPLKYKNRNNELSETSEVSSVEDLRNYAVSRIFLDNISHIKAYWPMMGRDLAAISLSFGVDDLDGTIQDTTKIYSMAGAKEQKPEMSVNEIVSLIKRNGFVAVERDSLYNPLKIFGN
jgi:aminodeoxyfutalosine synthase